MSLPKDDDRGILRTFAASTATGKAGVVRAAAEGRAMVRAAGPQRMWRMRGDQLFWLAMQRPQAGGKELGDAYCG